MLRGSERGGQIECPRRIKRRILNVRPVAHQSRPFHGGRQIWAAQIKSISAAWSRLDDHLRAAHLDAAAPLRAISIINGWLGYMGPCHVNKVQHDVIGRIPALAGLQGFDEIPARRELLSYWQCAYARWHSAQQDVACRTMSTPADWVKMSLRLHRARDAVCHHRV
jgi:hypothetical protein